MKRRVAVLLHSSQREQDMGRYLIGHLAAIWREVGLDVVFLSGVERHIPADVLIVHVDLSVVPISYLDFAGRYRVAVNGHVKDIRKSSITENRITRQSGYNGKVIVKSDLNQRGRPERALARPAIFRSLLRNRLIGRVVRRVAGSIRGRDDYLIYEHLENVPEEYFDRDDIIVERFTPEFENGLYHVRNFDFLGDHFTCIRVASANEVVRGHAVVRSEVVDPHPQLFELRSRLKLDYGKLDYVIQRGEVVLLDVNKTMGAGSLPLDDELRTARRRHWAAGIQEFLEMSG